METDDQRNEARIELPAPSPAPPEAPRGVPPGLEGWLGFIGVILCIGGALNCLSCINLPFGILMLLGGVALFGAKGLLKDMTTVDAPTARFLEKLKSAAQFIGIGFIVMLVVVALLMLVYFSFFVAVIVAALQQSA